MQIKIGMIRVIRVTEVGGPSARDYFINPDAIAYYFFRNWSMHDDDDPSGTIVISVGDRMIALTKESSKRLMDLVEVK